MFILVKVVTDENDNAPEPNLVNLNYIKRIAFVRGKPLAEIYFQGSAGEDKKTGVSLEDWVRVKVEDKKAFVETLKAKGCAIETKLE